MRTFSVIRAAILAAVFVSSSHAAWAQAPASPPPVQSGSVAGKVMSASGAPAEGAEVISVDLRRRTTADATGAFRFDGVPPGTYLLQAESPRFGSSVSRVEVAAGQESDGRPHAGHRRRTRRRWS